MIFFELADFETRLGFLDVKTSPVHFFVQRQKTFEENGAIIPFDMEQLNMGGAMNMASGTFTAPVNGIYRFDFSGIKNEKGSIFIDQKVNGNFIGAANSGVLDNDKQVPVSLQTTLRLRAGDRVQLNSSYHNGGMLYSDLYRTHFTGSLLEEDLSF